MGSVFDLYASLTLDSMAYEKGLKNAQNKATGFGKITQAAGKIAKKGIGAAAAGLVDFGKDSFNVGKEFDSAMSQVAATMGKSVEDISDMEEAAKELGATTSFTATEAAEGFNYLALAGYSTKQSIATLPAVLDLAAAGSMGLGDAADMVTDAMAALGLEADENGVNVTDFGDKLAKTASKTNTSVSQLGEAILTVGGTAQSIKGSYAILADGSWQAISGTSNLNAALGILANVGIKGAEGGTHLRNVLLSLQSPTDTAASAMEALGLEVYDSNGEMRDLNSIMVDLNGKLAGMDEAAKNDYLGQIFNKTDLAAATALLDGAGSSWDELAAQIENSGGAMAEMADTQLNNLDGSLTLMSSAVDGLKLALYDTFSDTANETVKGFTDIIGDVTTFVSDHSEEITTAFNTLSETAGSVFSAVGTVIEAVLPVAEPIFTGLLSGIQGICDLINGDFSGAFTAAGELIGGIFEGIGGAADLVFGTVSDIFSGLTESIGTVAGDIATGISGIADDVMSWAGDVANTVGGAVQGAMNTVGGWLDSIGDFFFGSEDEIAEAVAEEFGDMSGEVDDATKEAYDYVQKNFNQISKIVDQYSQEDLEAMQTAYNDMSVAVTEAMSQASEAVDTNFEQMASKTRSSIAAQKTTVMLGFSDMKSTVTQSMSTIYSTTSTNLSLFKDKWKQTMEDIETNINSVLGRIEKAFNKTYTVKVTSQGASGSNETEHFAKAMNQAYVLNSPTVFGNMGGRDLVAGDAGSEMVVGTDYLMNTISAASGANVVAPIIGSYMEQMLNVMQEWFPQFANQGVYIDSGALVGQISAKMDSALGRKAIRRGATAV